MMAFTPASRGKYLYSSPFFSIVEEEGAFESRIQTL